MSVLNGNAPYIWVKNPDYKEVGHGWPLKDVPDKVNAKDNYREDLNIRKKRLDYYRSLAEAKLPLEWKNYDE